MFIWKIMQGNVTVKKERQIMTETRRLYYEDVYKKEFTATVVECREQKKGYAVILDESAFYPEGGGQPSDVGTLGDAKVTEVHEKDGELLHYTDKALEVGAKVEGKIDWARRFDLMQQHSGEHMVSGIIHEKYGYDNVGFHMGSDVITVDLNGMLDDAQLAEIEREVNERVWEDKEVVITYPDAEELKTIDYRSKKELTGQVRIVTFPGVDVCACCGTHVKQAGEIGLIKILGMINYKGGVRISMLCGRKAMLDYERKQKTTTAISVLLSAKPDRLTESVEKLKNDSQAKDTVINQLYQRLFQTLVQTRPDSEEWLFVKEDNLSPVQLRQYCTMLYEQKKGKVVLVCSGENEEWKYALGSAEADMRELSRRLNAALNGRGGGSNLMAQGTFHAVESEIAKVWNEMIEA